MSDFADANYELLASRTFTLHYTEADGVNILLAIAGDSLHIYDATEQIVPGIDVYLCEDNGDSELDCELQNSTPIPINGDTITLSDGNNLTYTGTFETAQTNVGDYPTILDSSFFTVANNFGTDITSQYDISTQNGLLRIIPRQVTISILDVDMEDSEVQTLTALVADNPPSTLVPDHFLATTEVEVQIVGGGSHAFYRVTNLGRLR